MTETDILDGGRAGGMNEEGKRSRGRREYVILRDLRTREPCYCRATSQCSNASRCVAASLRRIVTEGIEVEEKERATGSRGDRLDRF